MSIRDFNGKVNDWCLNMKRFESLNEARELVELRLVQYNAM